MQTWHSLLEKSSGEYHIFCKNLTDGHIIAHDENARVETASVIKLPILLALLDKVQKRKLSLRQAIYVHPEDVGKNGSGIMQYFYLHRPFELYNLLVLMMSISDNVATNVIIRLLGKDAINQYMRASGFTQTELIAPKLDFPDNFSLKTNQKLGLTIPKEMALLVERLVIGDLLDQTNTKLAMKLLQEIQTSRFQRRLPRQHVRKFGSKSGSLYDGAEPTAVLNEAGYIVDISGNRYIFSVFSTLPIQKQYRTFDTAASAEFAELAAQLFRKLRAT